MRRMLMGVLHCGNKVFYWLQLPIPQSHHLPFSDTILSEHIYHDTESYTRSRLPTPAAQSFVYSLQKPQILINGGVALLPCPQVENVQCRVEKIRKLQICAWSA